MKRAKDYFLRNPVIPAQLDVVRSNALKFGEEFDLFDSSTDQLWANFIEDANAPNPYYDYFYSGNDIKVYIAEIAGNDPEYGECPIVTFGYNISQQKRPVFGFWDYTHSAVMRGTRVVNGQFSVVTKHPNYMRNMLAKAAQNRANNQGHLADAYPAMVNLTEDDSNIDKYWGKNLDPAYLRGAGNQEFSVHPPFNFVIVYGVQEFTCDDEESNPALYADLNHRLIDTETKDSTRPNKIILEGCELTGMNRAYAPDGQVLVETYEFFARDTNTPQ